jgi:hypothetical protein
LATLSASTVVVRCPDAITRAAGEALLMLDSRNNAYFELDSVGRRIWDLIAEPRQVGALCQTLVGEFVVSAETCEADVLAFLEKLAAADLVTVR